MIDIFKYDGILPDKLKNRSQTDEAAVNDVVSAIIADVRARGEEALREYTRRFDGVDVENFVLGQKEILEGAEGADPKLFGVMTRAAQNIQAFHQKQKRQSFIDLDGEITLGQLILPINSVGVYAPGGTALYPSSVLMNVIPARVAGVRRVALATPPSRDGGVDKNILAAAYIAGVDEVYTVGGAQAIAALAYGTRSIAPVDKIVGPGNVYVANAKRQVFGVCGIDMIAGPSEVLVVADDSADAKYVAADLLSQAEHDARSAVMLVTDSQRLATAVAAEVERQLAGLSRRDIAEKAVRDYGAIMLVDDIEMAMWAANLIAPEHLELCVREPYALLKLVQNAGSVFLGHYSPEPLGDYYAGPNHVLPTSGTARFSSPLGVDDFIKRTSFVQYSREALREASASIEAFAESEGLTAHANSIKVRFEE